MTEAEWLTCGDSALLLTHAGRNASDRKVTLFRCAVNRRLTQYPDGIDVDAIFRVAEARADGVAPVKVVEETANLIARTQAALLPWAVPSRWVQLHGACWYLINLLRPDEPPKPTWTR